ncbi:hypothetical protein, unlikely [Trypanosoma brucei gambiense DAL972]|uniref:Uncharacterized protein n=1 Tax=Trypanosoma brucei gambiense (strain MHOM/CI/86/DAL972) TaxID=679716 RepID=C9ZW74_TRYB9|nr:hypothetical protein, unlikely [Trypanosoma brucei gambiense DAL972]CBH13663.1 hypothetical protein, unlikely [Trypanosoma brucei gambiense DAL972]|eukprot:XP_011775939.1 hypothetical protein, unlikely [Trypanosoma brucei gambiense DAL972]
MSRGRETHVSRINIRTRRRMSVYPLHSFTLILHACGGKYLFHVCFKVFPPSGPLPLSQREEGVLSCFGKRRIKERWEAKKKRKKTIERCDTVVFHECFTVLKGEKK